MRRAPNPSPNPTLMKIGASTVACKIGSLEHFGDGDFMITPDGKHAGDRNDKYVSPRFTAYKKASII